MMEVTKDSNGEWVAPDGTRAGDKIPNSKFFRAFCVGCGQPIRVASEKVLSSECNECFKTLKYTLEELEEEGLTFHYFDDRNKHAN
jgi:ribosomal protein S27E